MLSIIAIFVGLILCGVGYVSKEQATKVLFWIVGIVILLVGILTLTRGGVHFT